MKKIKNVFEKHDLIKIVLLAVLVTLVFTWLIPVGTLSGGEYTKTGFARTGIFDIMLSGLYSFNFFMQQILFIIFVGIFYGILTHVSGYSALVNKIATKMKGKEKFFVIGVSFVIALLTSILTQSYILLAFIPFIVHIASRMKLDKVTTFLLTFGSMLVGILGATYGYEGFIYFINYLNYFQVVTVTEQIGIRFVILALTFVVYSFFTIMHMNKEEKNKKAEISEGLITLEENKDKKVKVWPMAVFMGMLLVFTILGYVNWMGNFNIEIFDKFHNWLLELTVGKFNVISYILGQNATAFGSWDLYTLSIIMAFILILSVVIYRVKFDDLLDNILDSIKNIMKPIIILVLIYVVFVLVYWSPFTVTIINFISSFASGFNPFLAIISAAISSLFHIDFGYAGYVLGDLLTTTYGEFFNIGIVVYVAINGLVQFVAPTSAVLLLGLSYLDIPYKTWIKHIWKFALIMLGLLVIIFALLTYI